MSMPFSCLLMENVRTSAKLDQFYSEVKMKAAHPHLITAKVNEVRDNFAEVIAKYRDADTNTTDMLREYNGWWLRDRQTTEKLLWH